MKPLDAAMPPSFAPEEGGTMVYTVDLGNGQVVDIEGPPGATPEQLQATVAQSGVSGQGGPEETIASEEDNPLPQTRLEPQDEAAVMDMMRQGKFEEAVRFLGARGFQFPNRANVEKAYEQTGQVSDAAYALPMPEDRSVADAAAYGALDTVMLGLPDEARAFVAGLDFGGEGSFSDRFTRELDVARGEQAYDQANHPWARLGGQAAGAVALPSGWRQVGLNAGRSALRSGASMAEARSAAAAAIRNRLAVEGGSYGVAHGAGAGDTFDERLSGAAIEGAVGTAGGALFGKVGEMMQPARAARAAAARAEPVPEARHFVEAADRQGIDFIAADIPGATKSRFATAVSGVTLGGIPLAERAQQVIESARAARDALASRVGLVNDKTGAGQAAQRGAREWMATTEGRGQALERAIPINPQAQVALTETRDKLHFLTTGLKSNPELSRLWAENGRLKKTLDALTPKEKVIPGKPAEQGGMGFGVDVDPVPAVPAQRTGEFEGGTLSWEDMRRFRSIIGQIIGQPGLQSDGPTIDGLRSLYGALSADMRATAEKTGPRALTAFNRVNQFWRGREARIGGVLADVLGKDNGKGAQPAFEAIQRLANAKGGDPGKLARTLRSMTADEANTVRATILHQIGTVSKGRNDVSGEVFSPADFATHWNDMSPRARAILFQGQHLRDLTDIARVADGMKQAGKFANTSKTGIATTALGTVSSGFANPFLPFLMGALQFGGGKLLASEKMARWVASAAKKPNVQASLAHVERLGGIARAEPAIANEVLGLQQRLAEAFASAPQARLAAEQPLNETAGVRDQQQ